MAPKERAPDNANKAPKELVCGKGYTWSFTKAGYTRWRVSSWDAGTDAEDLVRDFSKATEKAAKAWAEDAKCSGPCPGKEECSKGGIRIGPPSANGDRNTWPPVYDRKYEKCTIYVKVTCEATVICYCGNRDPEMTKGSTELP